MKDKQQNTEVDVTRKSDFRVTRSELGSGWYTAHEISKLGIPGYKITPRAMITRLEREEWEYRKVVGQGPDGTKKVYRPPPHVQALIEATKREEITEYSSNETRPKLVAREERGLYLVIRDADGNQVEELVRVPRRDVMVSGGGGAVVNSEQIVDWLVFKASWVRNNGLQPEHLVLVEAVGESMIPTIQRGDVLLVDMRSKQPSQEAIFVIRRDDTLLVKRLQLMFTGEIYIKSDNPAYTTEIIPEDRTQELEIIGRVVWSGRKM